MTDYKINRDLVERLISLQFPQFKILPIAEVVNQGHDNRTFRLGSDKLIRLPSAEVYCNQVKKEQSCLPLINPIISLKTPKPVKMGTPCDIYPFHFSIYEWIIGELPQLETFTKEQTFNLSKNLTKFLKQLHSIDSSTIPLPGKHNYYRGGSLQHYDIEIRSNISKLNAIIDTSKALSLWRKALSSKWEKKPVIIHGDLVTSNILAIKGTLVAVIDFGCLAAGDPACDLTSFWSILSGDASITFKDALNMDESTWNRAKGWMFWKATYEMTRIKNPNSSKYQHFHKITNRLLQD